MRIAATADVHSPRYLNEFKSALLSCKKPDLFLFAGDMINRGKSDEYLNVLDAIDSLLGPDIPILACFGNEEPVACRDELHQITEDRVTFLDEEVLSINQNGSQLSIIGMSTVISEPPQVRANMLTEIRSIFDERVIVLSKLLQEASCSAGIVILLMHFSPMLENGAIEYSWWISEAIETYPPNFIIHGHIHNSKVNEIEIGTTSIRNVALPAIGSITEFNL
jgi:Icc-related predicted phosphoesterase